MNKKAFTLIELIVVIAIIGFLWMVWVMTFMQWFSKSHDASRTAALQNMAMALETNLARSTTFPMPDDSVEIQYSWQTLSYQWKFWEQVVNNLSEIKKAPKDPKDNVYYTYTISADKKSYGLLALMEWETQAVAYNPFVQEVYAVDYKDRKAVLEWNVTVLLDENKVPVEEKGQTINLTGWSTEKFIWVFNKRETIITWGNILKYSVLARWKTYKSCKEILDNESIFKWKDWVYFINPTWVSWSWFNVYCDMTTEGWWWTILSKNWKWSQPTVEAQCWPWNSITNLDKEDSDYLIHCDVWQTEILIVQIEGNKKYYVVWTSYAPWETNEQGLQQWDCAIKATKTGINDCIWKDNDWNLLENKEFKIIEHNLWITIDYARIWRIGENNYRNTHYIYDIWNSNEKWIWNWNNYYRTIANGNQSWQDPMPWYIWVR